MDMAYPLGPTAGFDLAAACLREGLPLVEAEDGKGDADTIAAAVQAAAHMTSLCRGGNAVQVAFAAVDSDIIELLAKYLAYLSRWQRPYYSERAAVYEAKARGNSSSSSSVPPPASSSSSGSGNSRFKFPPLSSSSRSTWTYAMHIMAQHIRTAAAIASGDVPAEPEMYSEVGRMLVHVLKDVMGQVNEPVTWLTDTAQSLARLLQHLKPQQLLLEATAMLDVFCSLMQAQEAVAENYTTWPAFSAAGLGPMIQFALVLLQPTKGSRPSGAVEKVLVELSQAYFKIRYHPIVVPTYSQALALLLEKQPDADSEDEADGDSGEPPSAVPPRQPPVTGMWSVYNCMEPANLLGWSALTGVCTALAHAEQQQQKQKQKPAQANSSPQQQQQQQQQQQKDGEHKGQKSKDASAQQPSKQQQQQQQQQQQAPGQPPRRTGWPIVSVQQRLPCPKERRLMQGSATLVELTPEEGQSLLKAAAGALLGATLWVVWPAVVRDMAALKHLGERAASVEWVEPRPSPAAAAGNSSSSDGDASGSEEGCEDTLQRADQQGGSEDPFADVGTAAAAEGGAGVGGVGFLKGALSTAVAGIKAIGTALTRAASGGGGQDPAWPPCPGSGSSNMDDSSSSSSSSPRVRVKLVPYTPPRDAVVWCTALEVPFCPCCSNRMGGVDPDTGEVFGNSKQQQQQQQQQDDAGQKQKAVTVDNEQQQQQKTQKEDSGQAAHGTQQQQQQHRSPSKHAGHKDSTAAATEPAGVASAAAAAAAAKDSGSSQQAAVQQPSAAATKAATAAAAPKRRAGAAGTSSSSSTMAHDRHGPPVAAGGVTDVADRQAAIAQQLSTIRYRSRLPYPRPGDLIWPHLPGTSAAWLVTPPTLVPPLDQPDRVAARLGLLLEAAVRQSRVDLKQCSTLLLLLAVTLMRAQEEVRRGFLGGLQGQVLLQLLLAIVQTCGVNDPGSISYRASYYATLGAVTPAVMATAVDSIPAKVLSWGLHHTELGGPTAVLLLLTWCLLVPRSDWPPLEDPPGSSSSSSSSEDTGSVCSNSGDEHVDDSCSDGSDRLPSHSEHYGSSSSSSDDGGGGGGGLPPPRAPCPQVDLAYCLHHGFILSEASSDHHLVALSVPASHFQLAPDVPRSPLLLLLLEALLRRCLPGVYPCTAVTRLLLGYTDGPSWVHCSAAELAPLPSLLVTLSKRLSQVLLAPGLSVLELLGDCLTLVQRVVVGTLGLQLARPSEAGLQRSLLGAAARLLLVATRGLQQQLPERVRLEAPLGHTSRQTQAQDGVQGAEEQRAGNAAQADAAPADNSSSSGSGSVLEVELQRLVPLFGSDHQGLDRVFTPALFAMAWNPTTRHWMEPSLPPSATRAAPCSLPDLPAVSHASSFQNGNRPSRWLLEERDGCDPAAVMLLGAVLEALLVVPPALGLALQPRGVVTGVPAAFDSAGTSRAGGNSSSSSTRSGGSGGGRAAAGVLSGSSPGGQRTAEHIDAGLEFTLKALQKCLLCTPGLLLAGLPPGVTTLGGLLMAVQAAAVGVTQRVGAGEGAWCGALGCVNMAGCSEAELVVGRRQVVCGCCGVVAYCSPGCLAADAAAGRLKHHRRLPGAGKRLDMCD